MSPRPGRRDLRSGLAGLRLTLGALDFLTEATGIKGSLCPSVALNSLDGTARKAQTAVQTSTTGTERVPELEGSLPLVRNRSPGGLTDDASQALAWGKARLAEAQANLAVTVALSDRERAQKIEGLAAPGVGWTGKGRAARAVQRDARTASAEVQRSWTEVTFLVGLTPGEILDLPLLPSPGGRSPEPHCLRTGPAGQGSPGAGG